MRITRLKKPEYIWIFNDKQVITKRPGHRPLSDPILRPSKVGNTGVFCPVRIPACPATMDMVEGMEKRSVRYSQPQRSWQEAAGAPPAGHRQLNIFLTDAGAFRTGPTR